MLSLFIIISEKGARDAGCDSDNFGYLRLRVGHSLYPHSVQPLPSALSSPIPCPLLLLSPTATHRFFVPQCTLVAPSLDFSNLFLLTMLIPSLLALFATVAPVLAGLTGSFQTAGNTQVSGMMVRQSLDFFYSLLIRPSPDVCC
jgi:hypothetical protein